MNEKYYENEIDKLNKLCKIKKSNYLPKDKKKQKKINDNMKNKIAKEKRSKSRKSKFEDKHFLPISLKDEKIEQQIENLYIEEYKKIFGRCDDVIIEFQRTGYYYVDHVYGDAYADAHDDFYSDTNSVNSFDEMDYYDDHRMRKYFESVNALNEKIKNLHKEGKYNEIYKLKNAKITKAHLKFNKETILKKQTCKSQKKYLYEPTCSICWSNLCNIGLEKCAHGYCHECFSYNYFVLDNPPYCVICKSAIHNSNYTRIEFILSDK